MTSNEETGRLQDFTIDQFAGAFALMLGAVGTLLLVIWQSRCLCKCRLGINEHCECFYCERKPPPDEAKDDKKKKDNKKKDEKTKLEKTKSDEESVIPEQAEEKTPTSTPASTPKPNIIQLEEQGEKPNIKPLKFEEIKIQDT